MRPQMQRALPKFGQQPSPFGQVSGVTCRGDCARDRAIGERTNDQTCYRPRAVFLHVCVRHWHRDRCRKLAHLKRGASAGRLYAVVTKPTPNFTRLGAGRPEIAILVDAMLRAREVVAARPPKDGGLTFWLILVLAYGGGGAASTVVMVGERLRNAITGLRTSPVP